MTYDASTFTYEPGSLFSDSAKSPIGQALWRFLNSKEAVACLETSTYLGHPALEGLQPRLIAEFGDEIRDDQLKRMAGNMVRQIMEHHGYVLVEKAVRTAEGDLFTSAATYEKRG